MSWKAYNFESREDLGTYPDEMAMSLDMRERFPAGTRLVVENDDGAQYEAFIDTDVVKIVLDPPLSMTETAHAHEDENYSPYT